MKVDKSEMKGLLDATVTFVVPLFQRAYVWDEERWGTLWDDIEKTTDAALEERDGQHFLGAVVLEQVSTPAGRMYQRQVIDGQQRMITLQLLLLALRNYLKDSGLYEALAVDVEKYLFNTGAKVRDTQDKFKVWPTTVDQNAFEKAMTVQRDGYDSDSEQRFRSAVKYFGQSILQWVESSVSDSHSVEALIEELIHTVEARLALAVIDLDADDDAQEIFETLNALGTPLLPSDLVKNHLFRIAQSQNANYEKLYRDYWSKFDEQVSFWNQERSVGRERRKQIDIFLQYYLSLRLQDDVTYKSIFRSFRGFVSPRLEKNIEPVFKDLVNNAETYRSFFDGRGTGFVKTFFSRIDILETTVVYPLVLLIFDSQSEQAEREDMLAIIESYLVRRLVCRMGTKNYNRFILDAIRELKKIGVTAEALRSFLLGHESPNTVWPEDQTVVHAILSQPLYGYIRRNRLVMVLSALNEKMHTDRSEQVKITGPIEVEHLMPQKWQAFWPLPEGDPLELTRRREALVHTLGNLTLVTGSLNESVSNGTWKTKLQALRAFSNLAMNRRLLDKRQWDEQSIEERGRALAGMICEIWPR